MDGTFYDILVKLANEIVAEKKNLTEKKVLFLLQKYLNPYPPKIKDTFADLFKIKNDIEKKL